MTLKYIALAALLFAGACFMKEYMSRLALRRLEYRAVVALLVYLRYSVGRLLKPLPELLSAFSSECADDVRCPFTEALGLNSAEAAIAEIKLMDDEDVRELRSLFVKIGVGFKDEETEKLSVAANYFEERLGEVEEKTKSEEKLAPALFAALFAAVLIFFL